MVEQENKGFGAGNNAGMRAASGRWYLLLNSDAWLAPGRARRAGRLRRGTPGRGGRRPAPAQPRRHPPALGARLPERVADRDRVPVPAQARTALARAQRASTQAASTTTTAREAEFLMGSCLLVRGEAVAAVGGFDERYFMFSEETDWCYRFREAGWKVWFFPGAEAVHVGGATTRQNWGPMFVEQVRGHLRFLSDHRGEREAERARRLMLVALAARGRLFRGERGAAYRSAARWLASGRGLGAPRAMTYLNRFPVILLALPALLARAAASRRRARPRAAARRRHALPARPGDARRPGRCARPGSPPGCRSPWRCSPAPSASSSSSTPGSRSPWRSSWAPRSSPCRSPCGGGPRRCPREASSCSASAPPSAWRSGRWRRRSKATRSSISPGCASCGPSTSSRSTPWRSSATAGSIPATRSRSGTASSRWSRSSPASTRRSSRCTRRASWRRSRSRSCTRRALRSSARARSPSPLVLAQAALIGLAPGKGGAYAFLALPATASRQLLVPAVLALVFAHLLAPRLAWLGCIAAGGLALAIVHPTYAIFLCLPLGGLPRRPRPPLARRPQAARRGAGGTRRAERRGGARDRPARPRDRRRTRRREASCRRAFTHYAGQIDVFSETSYRLAPEVFGRGGAVAVAALLLIPLAALASRRRWAAFVLGGSIAVFAVTLVRFLFPRFADVVSLSQARRAAGFVPLAFAFAGGTAVLAELFSAAVLPFAFAAGSCSCRPPTRATSATRSRAAARRSSAGSPRSAEQPRSSRRPSCAGSWSHSSGGG